MYQSSPSPTCPRASASTSSAGKKLTFFNVSPVAILALALVAGSAHAQMFKCVLPGGKVEYRGSACDDVRQDTPIHGAISNVPAMPQRDIEQATRAQPAPAGPSMTIIGGEQRRGVPTDRDVKNLETSASSVTMGQKEKRFLQDEVRRAKLARDGGTAYSENDKRELEHLRSLQTSADLQARERARRQAEQIHIRTGDPLLAEDVRLARQAEQEHDDARQAAAEEERKERVRRAALAPRQLVNCDRSGCWDNTGARYNRAGGGTFFRSDGKYCMPMAGGVTCN
jgi:hypothetical protein